MLSKYMTGKVYADRDFPGCASIKEFAHQRRRHKRLGLIPGSGRSPGGGCGNPLQYSFLDNPLDRGAWQTVVYSISESDMTEAT